MRAALLSAAAALSLFAGGASAATFDVSTEYRMRMLSYKNLNLNCDIPNDQSFISQRARLGFALKDIDLGDHKGEPQSMDVSIRLHAVGIAGSSAAAQAPFHAIAGHYPNTSLNPFLENALIKTRNLAGFPWDAVFGLQSFSLGSGLLLDDDGAGLTGISSKGPLPWLGMSGQAFVFQARNNRTGTNNLDVFGFSIDMPTEGTWQLNQLIEKDRTTQYAAVTGCTPNPALNPTGECLVGRATRWFSSVRYTLNLGPLVFDGEAAMEKGAATPTGTNQPGNHITYNGNAQILKAKWKQPLWSQTQGIVRLVAARGSGDNPSTPTTDEAFFPSRGHRYDGMERVGFGEFFAATPYDAFGGQSTATASGLHRQASGVIVVGIGVTPPAYKGVVLDIDHYLFQSDRNQGPSRTLGSETDLRLRYDVRDRFSLKATAAFFTTGAASNPTQNKGRRYLLEASARF